MSRAEAVVLMMHIFYGRETCFGEPLSTMPTVLPLHPQLSVPRDALNLSEIPFLIAQGADGSSFQPSLDAVQMKDVATISKGDGKAIIIGR